MSSAPLSVVVVYPHLPHYRYGLFKALVEDERLEVSYVADSREATGTIETIPFDLLPVAGVHNSRVGPGLWQRGLIRLLLLKRPDAVVFLGDVSHLSTWVATALLRLLRRPVYFWTIGWHRPERGAKRLARLVFYRLASHLLLYGEVGREIGAQMGYPPSRMTRVGNSRTSSKSLDEPRLDETSLIEEALRDCAPNVAVSIVRLNSTKRLDLLVEAGGILQENGHDLTILIVGDGPERPALERQASDLGLDVRFLGSLYAEKSLAKVYAAADVTVIPSAAGLTVIQSLEFGTPVITHDDPYGQMPESEAVRPGVTGDLYAAGDVADLALKMSAWFDGRARTSEVAAACRNEVSERWSAESQAQVIASVLLSSAAK